MGKVIVLSLRAVQAVLALANLGLSAYLIDWYLTRTRFASPHVFNFLLVAPIFSFLSIVYLEVAPRFAPRASHPFASLAVESLNALFYFSGFIACAVFITSLAFCNGVQCPAGKADAGIAGINFLAWIATTVLVAKDIFKGGLRKPSGAMPRGPTRPGPMAQV